MFLSLAITEKHLCRAGLVALSFPHAQEPIESTKVQFSTSARLATNAMLWAVFLFQNGSSSSSSLFSVVFTLVVWAINLSNSKNSFNFVGKKVSG